MPSTNKFVAVWSSLFLGAVNASPTPSHTTQSLALNALSRLEKRIDDTSSTLRNQYTNPLEILSVLLIIGGDIVQRAIAQLAGGPFTPVSFSFGWVSYAFGALMSAFGDGMFMPEPDVSSKVITVKSRIGKINESWVIARLIRDLEIQIWRDMRDKRELWRLESGLIATVYQTQPEAKSTADIEVDQSKPPKFKPDKIWLSFFGICFLQLVVAAIPIILHNNWEIILVTAIGTILALFTGSLRQYVTEKYHCRRNAKQDFIITRGNGHNHVFLLLHQIGTNAKWREDEPDGPNGPRFVGLSLVLEDLANVPYDVRASRKTRGTLIITAILWIFLLITVGGLTQDTWYLFLVGTLGMGHNIAVAGVTRTPSAHGIPLSDPVCTFGLSGKNSKDLDYDPRIHRPKVIKTLEALENEYPGAGVALIGEFFPAGLRTKPAHPNEMSEEAKWKGLKDSISDRAEEIRTRREQQNRIQGVAPTQEDLIVPDLAKSPVDPAQKEVEPKVRHTEGDGGE